MFVIWSFLAKKGAGDRLLPAWLEQWHNRAGVRVPDFVIERQCEGVVCGIDEAGRGPFAGPVVAAAVIIDRRRFRGDLRRVLDDSKALSRELRERCYAGLYAGVPGGLIA